MKIADSVLAAHLRNVLWIGGGPCGARQQSLTFLQTSTDSLHTIRRTTSSSTRKPPATRSIRRCSEWSKSISAWVQVSLLMHRVANKPMQPICQAAVARQTVEQHVMPQLP